jgi:hypothetical protein
MACPHKTGQGYTTAQGRKDWLTAHNIPQGDHASIADTLSADPDRTKPLFYWQIHSIVGADWVYSLITRFYERVYADEEDPEFRHAFSRISGIEHHVATQSSFWVDSFGGGKCYISTTATTRGR